MIKDQIINLIKNELGFRDVDENKNCTNCKDIVLYSMCEPLCGRNPEFKFVVSENTICNKYGNRENRR